MPGIFEGRADDWGVAEQDDPLNHPHPISLGDHGYRAYRFLRSCKSGVANQPFPASQAARASSCSSGSGWVEAQRIGGGG